MEWGKVTKPIKVVSVAEIAGGDCQGMCLDVLFSLTYLVNLKESPNRPVEKATKGFPVAKICPRGNLPMQCVTSKTDCKRDR